MANPVYHSYLKSPSWFKKRRRILQKADYECEVCGAHGVTLQVHHLTYERIFHESEADLLASCKPCHKHLDVIRKALNRITKSDLDKFMLVKQVLSNFGYPRELKTRKNLKELKKIVLQIDRGESEILRAVKNVPKGLRNEILGG